MTTAHASSAQRRADTSTPRYAGSLIARESGAAVVFEGKSVICAAPGIVDELVTLVREARDGS